MRTGSIETILENQNITIDLQFFHKDDMSILSDIYRKWVELSDILQSSGGRRINIPEILSEGVFCYHFDSGRTLGGNSKINMSFDCLKLNPVSRVQVKSCSVISDLTSFGPRSVWDELYFVHFFPNRSYDGSYEIYEVPNRLVYNHKVNKYQTFQQQQELNRRPRFSLIDEIIRPNNIQPVVAASLFS